MEIKGYTINADNSAIYSVLLNFRVNWRKFQSLFRLWSRIEMNDIKWILADTMDMHLTTM